MMKRPISRIRWPFYKLYLKVKWSGPWGRRKKEKLSAQLEDLRTRLLEKSE